MPGLDQGEEPGQLQRCGGRRKRTGASGNDAHISRADGDYYGEQAEYYRAKARECETLAEQDPDSFIKEQLLAVAKTWRNMAAYEEKRSR
jgi:hypothetical protein